MNQPGNLHDDDDLLDALDDAFESTLQDIPAELSRFALEAFEWTGIDGELARLSADSSARPLEAARGAHDERVLTFESTTVTISLQVSAGVVVGWIQPEDSYEVTLTTPTGGSANVTTDPIGRFRTEIATPFRLTVQSSSGPSVTTEWITA
jgi:hypothetical protein